MDSKAAAIELFGILDDIDTLDDICKEDDEVFRELVMHEVAKRFKYAETDGTKVYLRSVD